MIEIHVKQQYLSQRYVNLHHILAPYKRGEGGPKSFLAGDG